MPKIPSMQTVFNKVVKHLFKQGERAMGVNSCLYRSPEGLSCAAGCLLPDEVYNPDWESILEGGNDFRTGRQLAEMFPELFGPSPELIAKLQEAHDNGRHWDVDKAGLKAELQHIATAFSLKLPKVAR